MNKATKTIKIISANEDQYYKSLVGKTFKVDNECPMFWYVNGTSLGNIGFDKKDTKLIN